MSKQLKVYCKNIEEYIDINGGDSLLDIYRKIANRIPFNPVCARVNYKAEDLSYAVFHPKMVEFLPVTSASGTRTYVRSLCMMLYKAVAECFPGKKLCIEHSISNGYFCRINDGWVPDESNVNTLKNKMTEYVEADIPFERKERLTKDVIEIFRHQSLDDKVLLLETLNELYTTYYRLGDICDSYYGQLVPNTL